MRAIKLAPFYSYFGSKYRATKYYPAPKYDTIIEPFAGSAGYSLNYADKRVRLYDLNPIICGVWDYLIKATEADILRLPSYVADTRLLPASICQEARWLIGFLLNRVSAGPRHQRTRWSDEYEGSVSYWGERAQIRIASQLKHIRHWKVFCKSYKYVDNCQATWFIDPPYQHDWGKFYVKNTIDYDHLAQFCRERQGQTIVCEAADATWLPFKRLRVMNTVDRYRKGVSWEVYWTNEDVSPRP